ncbi:MAG: reductive dehalogenase domain-containing protein [Rhizobiaceae bacterium]
MSTWPKNRSAAEVEAQKVADLNRRFAQSDQLAGIEVTDEFQRFNQRDDLFTRAFWDPEVHSSHAMGFFDSYRMKAAPRSGDGFSVRDFALRNAAWSVSDMVTNRRAAEGRREGFQAPIEPDTPVAEFREEVGDPQEMADEIKRVARFFGADLAAICELDERWHYTKRVDTRDLSEADNSLPEEITHVIVLGHEMDRGLVETYPSALAGAATGREYSHEAAIVIQLASYIRNLGYEAIPSMNDTSLVIPYAIKAGLGDYGRHQMVITPQFGPRLRFSKIFTSLPLAVDRPVRHGIAEYCSQCTRCADQCPPKALPFGAPDTNRPNRSAIAGVKKWTADCEKCFGYWAKLKSDCAICMRVCPFNRDFTRWTNRLWRWFATGRLRWLALAWEKRYPTGARKRPRDWWKSA